MSKTTEKFAAHDKKTDWKIFLMENERKKREAIWKNFLTIKEQTNSEREIGKTVTVNGNAVKLKMKTKLQKQVITIQLKISVVKR